MNRRSFIRNLLGTALILGVATGEIVKLKPKPAFKRGDFAFTEFGHYVFDDKDGLWKLLAFRPVPYSYYFLLKAPTELSQLPPDSKIARLND